MKDLPVRTANRLKDYDYSQEGCYFVTICVKEKHEILWNMPVGARIARPPSSNTADSFCETTHLPLSDTGEIVKTTIENIPENYSGVSVEKYVIMPNHIHMILTITGNECAETEENGRAMRAPTISTVINQMKGIVTKRLGYSLWQKSFHDHIIRNEEDYQRIWQYIDENPARWQEDEYFVKDNSFIM